MKINKIIALIISSVLINGCSSDADLAADSISKSADNFEINRKIIFYNGITGEYILSIEGLCALGNFDKDKQLSVTCKTSATTYKKHFLGLSDNVTYFAEQIDPTSANIYQYKVIFKPTVILPDLIIKIPTNSNQLNAPKITKWFKA